MTLPARVLAAQARADAAGFELSCEPEVGRFLAVLAAAVPAGGRALEIGTGAGVGTAWLAEGLRDDAALVTVDVDAQASELARRGDWPSNVSFVVGDALDAVDGTFDLIFADAPAGKWTGFGETVAALNPGGIVVVDDMAQADDPSSPWREQLQRTRETILGYEGLVAAELAFGSGVIVATKLG